MAQVRARRGIGHHLGEKLALLALEACFVSLGTLGFILERLAGGKKRRKFLRAARAQLVDSQEVAAPSGQAVVSS